jgi:hypothetical protein
MAVPAALDERDPLYHVHRIRRMLDDVARHAHEDVEKVNDPKARVLFETTAEVLRGLATAYEHFAVRAEPAWR